MTHNLQITISKPLLRLRNLAVAMAPTTRDLAQLHQPFHPIPSPKDLDSQQAKLQIHEVQTSRSSMLNQNSIDLS